MLSTGSDFPDSIVTCYNSVGDKIEKTGEDVIMDPETTCISLSTGHLGGGFLQEFFCNSVGDTHFWTVNLRDMN